MTKIDKLDIYKLTNMEIQHAIYNAEPKRLIDPWLMDQYMLQFRAVADKATRQVLDELKANN
tara:strand:+ start:1542 stop:1727 length:186 start_codon:yes stop_codon:yes gene_type:complete